MGVTAAPRYQRVLVAIGRGLLEALFVTLIVSALRAWVISAIGPGGVVDRNTVPRIFLGFWSDVGLLLSRLPLTVLEILLVVAIITAVSYIGHLARRSVVGSSIFGAVIGLAAAIPFFALMLAAALFERDRAGLFFWTLIVTVAAAVAGPFNSVVQRQAAMNLSAFLRALCTVLPSLLGVLVIAELIFGQRGAARLFVVAMNAEAIVFMLLFVYFAALLSVALRVAADCLDA